MVGIIGHRKILCEIILVLMVIALIGPWSRTPVPSGTSCEAWDDGQCYSFTPGLLIFLTGLMVTTGQIDISEAPLFKEDDPGLLIFVGLLLFYLPIFSSFFFLWERTNRWRWFQVVILCCALACGLYVVVVGFLLLQPSKETWGFWLYNALILCSLTLELLMAKFRIQPSLSDAKHS